MKCYMNDKMMSETLFDKIIMDAWILLEKHDPKVCTCSYCQQRMNENPTIKLWLPGCKARNSWRVLCWNRNGYFYFLRSTLPTWRWLIHFDRWSYGWRFHSLAIGKNSVRSLISISKGSSLPRWFNTIESILWILPK